VTLVEDLVQKTVELCNLMRGADNHTAATSLMFVAVDHVLRCHGSPERPSEEVVTDDLMQATEDYLVRVAELVKKVEASAV
jgi:hypothetical protein